MTDDDKGALAKAPALLDRLHAYVQYRDEQVMAAAMATQPQVPSRLGGHYVIFHSQKEEEAGGVEIPFDSEKGKAIMREFLKDNPLTPDEVAEVERDREKCKQSYIASNIFHAAMLPELQAIRQTVNEINTALGQCPEVNR